MCSTTRIFSAVEWNRSHHERLLQALNREKASSMVFVPISITLLHRNSSATAKLFHHGILWSQLVATFSVSPSQDRRRPR
ncbi:hypothetical protein Bca4012_030535 [Brassica carinata]|uniref:Uncharacterized protein n=1 Tax=Brassica carinata TaxID=52824 RepID=A0A8X7RIN8_BRACI|nr:hypothetical protein Bca52824_048186 [Brassica carinata]